MTDLALMAAFTTRMVYEKVGCRGEVVARAVGVALLAGAGAGAGAVALAALLDPAFTIG